MNALTDWLLRAPPWVAYSTRLEILNQPPESSEVQAARQAMLAHPQAAEIISELQSWPGEPLKSHKSAGHPLHKLVFLADIGFRVGDPGIDTIVGKIISQRDPQGIFQVLMNINPRYGGTGEDQFVWMLCDAPLLMSAIIRLGVPVDDVLMSAVENLIGLQRKNGFPCAVMPGLKFRGPGRKTDPCPYANLLMLKLLNEIPGYRDSEAARNASQSLLGLWDERHQRRPYLFAMGSGFQQLKAPLIWYDILHLTEVLSNYPAALQDARFQEMVEIVRQKADADGKFTPGSIWMAWKGWDFGQKKEPSTWLTFLAHRMLVRAGKPVMEIEL